MDGDKDLERLKKIAAAKARSAALAKKLEKEKQDQESSDRADHELAKLKAEAAAKAREAAQAKREAKTQQEQKSAVEPEKDLAQLKAEAAAKARAAAQAKKEAKQQDQGSAGEPVNDLAKQKAEAAAKAREAALAKREAKAQQEQGSAAEPEKDLAKQKAAAAARAKAAAQAKSADSAKTKEASAEVEEVRSVNQSYLDLYIKVIEEHLGNSVLEDYYINTLSKDVPTIVVKKEAYYKVAEFLKYNEQLAFDYLSELHGSDFETHMEVYTHLYSYKKHQSLAFKVKIDREAPMIDSLAPLWAGANWPECEAYDLLGIKFKGHPNLHRIMLGEDWIGHPLRKDYEPYDVEV
jgi:NADH-quinone oxidoreductase subunit C